MRKRILAFSMAAMMSISGALGSAVPSLAAEEDIFTTAVQDETLPVRYRVTLNAAPGCFESDGDKQLSEMDIFVTEGTTYGESVGVADGEEFTYEGLPIPTREGYEFSFWYADEEPGEYLFEDRIILDDKEVEPVDNRVFYAVWEKGKEQEQLSDDPDEYVDDAIESDEIHEVSEESGELDLAGGSDEGDSEEIPEDADEMLSEEVAEGEADRGAAVSAAEPDVAGVTDLTQELLREENDGSTSALSLTEELLKTGSEDETALAVTAADVVFSNKIGNFKTTVTVRDKNGRKLSAGKDYDKVFSYVYAEETLLLDGRVAAADDDAEDEDTVPAGTSMRVRITGKGAYDGMDGIGDFRITAMSISKAQVTIQNRIYDGVPVELEPSEVIVKVGKEILTPEDFEIDPSSYKNNNGKGKATVTLYGRGDYGGSKNASFTIENPPAGFAVMYYGNGASSGKMKKQTAAAESTVELTENKFVREGYTFRNWNTEPSGTGEAYEDKAVVEASQGKCLELYAQWIPGEFTLTYHTNGGENNPLNTINTFMADDETFDIYPPDKDNWPIGYQFGGWYSDSAYRNKVTRIKSGTGHNVDLYAKWVPYTFTIKFDGNGATGGSMKSATFSYGVSKKLPANKYKRSGYAFLGWFLPGDENDAIPDHPESVIPDKDDFSGVIKRDGYTNSFEKEITLYAVWGREFTIDYDAGGGSMPEGKDHDTYTFGSKMNLPVPTRYGYSFSGWYTDADCRVRLKSITAKTAGDLHLYAGWKPLKLTFIFKGNGAGSGRTKNQTLYYDQSTVLLNKCGFVKKGSRFRGWNTSETGDGFEIAYDRMTGAFTTDVAISEFLSDNYVLDGGVLKNNTKITLYAKWEESDYRISYVTGGGTLPDGAIESYAHGTQEGYDLPVPLKEDDTFLGWFLDPAFKKEIKRIIGDTYGDLILYARWGAGNKQAYKVKFYADAPDGAPVRGKMSDQKLIYNTAKALSANKYKIKGYTFKGWSLVPLEDREDKEADYLNKEVVTGFRLPDGSGDENQYRAEVELYGVWEKDVYTVTLCNINAPDIEDAVKTGTFVYSVDQQIVFAGPRSAGEAGAYIGDDEEDKAAAVRYLAEPYKLGDTFLGWYLDAKFRKKAGGITKGSTGNKTFYARWESTRYTINYDMNGGPADAKLDTEKAGFVTGYGSRYESGYLLATAYGTGKRFAGWYKEKSCRTRVGNIISSPYVDMTVYARWQDYTYSVVFDSNDPKSTGSMKSMTGLKMDKEYKLSKVGFKLSGYELDCWNTLAAPTEEDAGYSFENEAVISGRRLCDEGLIAETGGTLRLYAQWKIKEYQIIYHLNGGNNGDGNPETYNALSEVKTLSDPSLEGYKFIGWFRDPGFTDPVIKAPAEPDNPENYAIRIGTTGTLHFYAKWEYEMINIDDLQPDEYISLADNPQYPVDPTGETSSADSINNAIDKAYLNDDDEPRIVYLPAGKYNVDYNGHWYKSGILMRSNVTLLMDDETYLYFKSGEKADDCAISMINTENASVIGGHIIGENKANSYDRYGVWIKGTRNSTVANMEITAMPCDGIYLAVQQKSPPEVNTGNDGVNIINCNIHDNWRNNISIVDADNVTIENCTIAAAVKRQPCAGICIEPNPDCSGDGICSNIYVKNCDISTGMNGNDWHYRSFYVYNNHGHNNIGTRHVAENVTFDNCRLQGYIGNHHGKNVRFINGTTRNGTYDDNPDV